MRKANLTVLLLLLVSVAAQAQRARPSVLIVSKSQTDRPAAPGQASDEATAVARYLQDRVAIEIQEQYPCANATTDRDLRALLEWQRQRSLLDPNYEADLANMAGAVGARHLISVTATEAGGQVYLNAAAIDTATAKTRVRMGKQTSAGGGLADAAEALARDLVKGLTTLFAQKAEGGRTYPAWTVLQAVCDFRHSYEVSTWTQFQWWDERLGGFHEPGAGPYTPSVDERTCSARFTTQGRYRMVICKGRWSRCESHEVVGEFAIEGQCKK